MSTALQKKNMKKYKKSILITALTVFIILLFFALYAPLVEKTYSFGKGNIKVALITDYHSATLYYESLINKLINNTPDIILLGGDIIDDEEDVYGAELLLKTLSESPFSNIPKFYVTGNHEFWSNRIVEFKDLVKKYNIVVLDNLSPSFLINIKDENILISGICDPYVIKYDNLGRFIKKDYEENWQDKWVKDYLYNNFLTYDNILKKINNINGYENILWLKNIIVENANIKKIENSHKVLLTHRPEFVESYSKLPYEYILSGHTHGGQVNIPFILNGLYAPNQGLFPKYAGGLYNIDNGKNLIVSRGLSFNPIMPRIFNKAELVWVYF